MKSTMKPLVILLFSLLFGLNSFAQESADTLLSMANDPSHQQNIIITKKGAPKEKITLTIDGNNITVNGKPLDEFKSDSVDIMKMDLPDVASINLDLSNDLTNQFRDNQIQKINLDNQLKALHDQMHLSITSNKAILGVMTEQTGEGAKITDVTKQSAAAKAGLMNGDVITKINQVKITGPKDLYAAVGKLKPGDKVKVTILRNGSEVVKDAVLGKSEQPEIYSWNQPGNDFGGNFNNNFNHNFSFNWNNDKPRLGMEAQDTEDGNGVKVTDVDGDMPAAKAGLQDDDIITMMNGQKITSVDDLKNSVKDVKKGDTVKVTYMRDGKTQTVDMKFPKDLKTISL